MKSFPLSPFFPPLPDQGHGWLGRCREEKRTKGMASKHGPPCESCPCIQYPLCGGGGTKPITRLNFQKEMSEWCAGCWCPLMREFPPPFTDICWGSAPPWTDWLLSLLAVQRVEGNGHTGLSHYTYVITGSRGAAVWKTIIVYLTRLTPLQRVSADVTKSRGVKIKKMETCTPKSRSQNYSVASLGENTNWISFLFPSDCWHPKIPEKLCVAMTSSAVFNIGANWF